MGEKEQNNSSNFTYIQRSYRVVTRSERAGERADPALPYSYLIVVYMCLPLLDWGGLSIKAQRTPTSTPRSSQQRGQIAAAADTTTTTPPTNEELEDNNVTNTNNQGERKAAGLNGCGQ